jgi:DNA-binding HxlR family transcriptional regulator
LPLLVIFAILIIYGKSVGYKQHIQLPKKESVCKYIKPVVYFIYFVIKTISMYTKKMDEDLDCGIRVAFKIFGGKWKPCILDSINRGIVRPADIQKDIQIASLRVIEMQLAELLAYGAVVKSSEHSYPKKTEYEITPFGKTILPVIKQVDAWGAAHSAFVKLKQLEMDNVGVQV